MADDTVVKVIKISDGGSFKTMREWRNYIDQLRASMVELDSESAEYKERAEAVANAQDKVNRIMTVSKSKFNGAKDSVKGMRNELRSLTNAYDQLSAAERNSDFGKNLKNQINEITNNLKTVEEGTGRFQRNVGNYTNSIKDAFEGLGGSTKGLIAPIQGVGKAAKALMANPWIAVITGVLATVQKLANEFKKNKAAMDALKQAAVPFKAIMDGINTVFQKMVGVVASVVTGIGNLTSKLAENNPKLAAFLDLEQRIKDDEEQREEINRNIAKVAAETSREVATQQVIMEDETASEEDRLKAAKAIAAAKENERQERIKLLELNNKQNREEQALAIRNHEAAIEDEDHAKKLIEYEEKLAEATKERNRIQKEQRAYRNRNNTAQFKPQLEEAENDILIAEGELNTYVEKVIDNGWATFSDELLDKVNDTQNVLANELGAVGEEIERELQANNKRIHKSVERQNKEQAALARQTTQEQLNIEKGLIEQKLSLARDGSEEQYELQKELRDKEYEIDIFNAKTRMKNASDLNEALKLLAQKYNVDMLELEKAYSRKKIELQSKTLENEMNAYDKGQKGYYEAQVAYRQFVFDNLEKLDSESIEEFSAKVTQAYKALRDAQNQQRDWNIEIERQRLENEMNEYESGQDEFYQKKVTLLKYQLDNLHKTEEESNEAFRTRQIQAQKEYDDAVQEQAEFAAKRRQDALDNAAAEKAVKGPDSFEFYRANLESQQAYLDALVEAGRQETETEEEFAARRIAAEQSVADAKKALVEAQIGYWSDLATGIGSIMGSISEMYEEDIKARQKRGDISQEQAEAEFENVKNLQIAEATINTISGAIAAFMGCQSLGQPWGAILGAVQAAAVTAAGIAEIAKIKKTTLGSSSSSSSGGATALASVQPMMQDYTAQPVQTYTGKDETDTLVNALTERPIRSYVVESDISAKQELAHKRNNETSF